MNNRDRILDAALALFNASGTAAVSTNHIASALGISPGNLYYHFRNKEEIIRALFERLFAAWDTGLALPADRVPTLDDLWELIRENYRIIWDYRFAYRELIALLRHDPELAARFQAVRERGYAGFRELFAAFAAAGILAGPLRPAELDKLIDLCWLISEFWLPSLTGLQLRAGLQSGAGGTGRHCRTGEPWG